MNTAAKPVPANFKVRIHKLNAQIGALMGVYNSVASQIQHAQQQMNDLVALCREQLGISEEWELLNIEDGFVPKEDKSEE